MDPDSIRRRLQAVRDRTNSAQHLKPAAWWDGDKAGKQAVFADLKSGRTSWKQAFEHSQRGLQALDEGDTSLAETCLLESLYDLIASLEIQAARVRPSDRVNLSRSSNKRGRPRGAKSKKGQTVRRQSL